MSTAELQKTIDTMIVRGKGILAADESKPTAGKRLESVGMENTDENRRAYRDVFFSTPGIEEFISGVILFEETLQHKSSDGTLFPELLAKKGIVPGIKVDKGIIPLVNADGDKITQGLDGLAERLQGYKEYGARFTKWRAVLPITDVNPGCMGMFTNAEVLARYAAIAQDNGFVPIVEPELLIDGTHTIERSEAATEATLYEVFAAIRRHGVSLEHMILKPSMVISGKECAQQATAEDVAARTVKVLLRTVPAAVPSINFLSGGQDELQATQHLNLMNRSTQTLPWHVSFSYARALQGSALKIWAGKSENLSAAQENFYKRAKLNALASCGEYDQSMEK